jgi:hypothetical protein
MSTFLTLNAPYSPGLVLHPTRFRNAPRSIHGAKILGRLGRRTGLLELGQCLDGYGRLSLVIPSSIIVCVKESNKL